MLGTCSDQMTPLGTSRKRVSSTTLWADRKLTPWMVPAGMPLAATLKSQMLRLLRRSKSTRSNQAMVIPNKRYSAVIPESPAVIVERAREREASRNRSYSHSQARRHSKVRGLTFWAFPWRWWIRCGKQWTNLWSLENQNNLFGWSSIKNITCLEHNLHIRITFLRK